MLALYVLLAFINIQYTGLTSDYKNHSFKNYKLNLIHCHYFLDKIIIGYEHCYNGKCSQATSVADDVRVIIIVINLKYTLAKLSLSNYFSAIAMSLIKTLKEKFNDECFIKFTISYILQQ